MPEVIFTGAAGRIEGRYHPARQKNAPIGIVLHPHPQFGGTMNHQIIYQIYYAFVHRNFSVLRFNFRGVGRSQGSFDHGQGELSDAASALDVASDAVADNSSSPPSSFRPSTSSSMRNSPASTCAALARIVATVAGHAAIAWIIS